jgi:hypothetical protein
LDVRALLLALVVLGSVFVLAPSASACMTPAGGSGCDAGPVGVCLGIAIDSACRADLVCVTQSLDADAPGGACVQNSPL